MVKQNTPNAAFRRIRGVFCRLHGNSVRAQSQGLSQNKFCPAVDKEKGGIIRSKFCFRTTLKNDGCNGIIKQKRCGIEL